MGFFHWREVPAHQYLVLQAGFAKLSCRTPEIHKNMVGVGISNFEAHLTKSTHHHVTNFGVLLYFPCYVFFILQRS